MRVERDRVNVLNAPAAADDDVLERYGAFLVVGGAEEDVRDPGDEVDAELVAADVDVVDAVVALVANDLAPRLVAAVEIVHATLLSSVSLRVSPVRRSA